MKGGCVEWENTLLRSTVEAEVNALMRQSIKRFGELKIKNVRVLCTCNDRTDNLNKMPPCAPKGLKEGFKFHQYQLDAISWMNEFEKDGGKGKFESFLNGRNHQP